ncbi:dimethyl sulfoxide reductase anchor subunit family protein [Anianabacter salinae]|uniref:dimethyl sulfoxide reductase anchor subunit family protein n=1 Tax=Anianabacter salinae TaxID=2851023 RepID=UPI00225E6B99|nr:DmsC/YnfH family molybdoenzyme membrane anchor subunit [Anianabacter salinae]MBV0910933.1 dimethyl sulfoxide reductase anchor subunit [Anianabacter salinae]
MHPARSLILFTVLSGQGFGLLVFLGLGTPEVEGWRAFAAYALAFALAGGGLMSSAFHLGHPERALKAFREWRTSWLSREAWLSVAALSVNGLYGLCLMLGLRIAPLGWLGALLAIATVVATSMIYASLRTVPRWHRPEVPVLFVALALSGGALIAGQRWLGLSLLLIGAGLQLFAWMRGDRALAESGTSIHSATGLGMMGTVRSLEAPHTGENYLTREMVHVVGRKHAAKLRAIGAALAFAGPAFFLLWPGGATVFLAAPFHLLGTCVLRWLFFAQAEHVVGLYYGRR